MNNWKNASLWLINKCLVEMNGCLSPCGSYKVINNTLISEDENILTILGEKAI
jgi:hypothetical protein